MKLTDPHDHPEPHTMKWTQVEMDYINNRIETAVRQALADAALDKMAENARELGLSYEQPAQQEPVNTHCCHTCFNKSGSMILYRMILCPECGNKRCPKATNHELPCTNSNEPGQTGSIYTTPPAPAPDPDELTIAYMSGVYEGKKIGAKEGCNKLATWMMQCGFATGHGDTLDDLLCELDTEIEALEAKVNAYMEMMDANAKELDRLMAKEWVGLTDEEIVSLMPITGHRPITTFARDVEAKLKEKNT